MTITIEPKKDIPRSKEIEQEILEILNENVQELKERPHIYLTALINPWQQIMATVCKGIEGEEARRKWLDYSMGILNRQIMGYMAKHELIKPTA